MIQAREHAVVLGASVGGMLAARALSRHFARVTLLERDVLGETPVQRKGVPQGRHAHGLLAAGQLALERAFPGFKTDLEALGALTSDVGEGRWIVSGHALQLPHIGLRGVTCTRPVLETYVRGRLCQLPNVRIRAGDALGLHYADGRVQGVRLLDRRDGSAPETLRADLVVDATGRGSRAPAWLRELGYPAPKEDRIKVGIGYTTALYERRADHLAGRSVLVIGAAPPNLRCGVALAVDAEHWIVTLVGYLGVRADPSHAGFLDFASKLPANDLLQILSASQPASAFASMTFPHSQRRRYDQLRAHPEGFVVFGDAMCSFNPIYGQGMTVAALEADALDSCLASPGRKRLWRRFYRAAKAVVDVPWSITVGNDLCFDEVEGRRSLPGKLLNRYLARLLETAAHDAKVGEAFARVTHLLSPPGSLMQPRILARVLRGPRPAARVGTLTASGATVTEAGPPAR